MRAEEEGARWPHRSSKPAWRLILSPEGSTPSPLRQRSGGFERGFSSSATRVPTSARYVVGNLSDGQAYPALPTDRVAAVNLVPPAPEPAPHTPRHRYALAA